MKAIYKRELKAYFKNVNGFIFIALMFLVIGLYTMIYNLYMGYSGFEYAISGAAFVYILAVPILTMRVFSEDKRQNTDQLLYSLPISVKSIVFGKLFAMFTVLAIPIAVSCLYPLVLSIFGEVAFLTAYSSIVGFLLLGMALLSVGLFLSSLTDNQLISAVITLVVLLAVYWVETLALLIPTTAVASVISLIIICILVAIFLLYMTKSVIVAGVTAVAGTGTVAVLYMVKESIFEGLIQDLFSCFDVFSRMENFIYGLFDITAVVYYVSIIFIFTFLSIQSLEKRRWC